MTARKKPDDVQEIAVNIQLKDRNYNPRSEVVELADYETVEMFMRRIEAAIRRLLTEGS